MRMGLTMEEKKEEFPLVDTWGVEVEKVETQWEGILLAEWTKGVK